MKQILSLLLLLISVSVGGQDIYGTWVKTNMENLGDPKDAITAKRNAQYIR